MLKSNQAAREQVFGNVRQSLAQLDSTVKDCARDEFDRIMDIEPPIPVVDGLLIDNFIDKHTAVKGTVNVVRSYSEVPGAVSEYLNTHDLPSELLMGSSKYLANFDWPEDWKIEQRPAMKTDSVSVTDAVCAIAETGTIMLVNSSEFSSTHAFVPENHLVIFDAGQIVRHLDDALELASAHIEDNSPAVHMVTGPSKTADVEQTIQYGAHGPRRLHAIVIDTK